MPANGEQESADAEKVDEAIQVLRRGDLERAAALLTEVIRNTPFDYAFTDEHEDNVFLRFWDQEQFVYYVMTQNPQKNVHWTRNAYGRAFYYMGFLLVEAKQYEEALKPLAHGLLLEPEQPLFRLETGKALAMLRRNDSSLREYEAVLSRGDAVAPTPRAAALRGKGCQLIELTRLDEAEHALLASLELDPNSPVAHNELQYIAHLRAGGSPGAPSATTLLQTGNGNVCSLYGSLMQTGSVFNNKGQLVYVCEACEKRATKKWWQFWR